MINANEARKIAEANDTNGTLREVVERVMPTIEKAIRIACEAGCEGTLIKESTISKASGLHFWTKRTLMDAVQNELKSYGFNVSIPNSYTSIHVNW